MGVRPEYILSSSDESPYYTSMRSMADLLSKLGGDAPQTEELPDGWLQRRWGCWEGWTPRDWSPRVQGWKIHVSTVPDDAKETLARTTRICVARNVSFKFLYDPSGLQETNGKQHDRGTSGKFITIYPDDDEQLAELLAELEHALVDQRGPYILSDLRYGEAPVYVRYGAIMSFSFPDGQDRPVNAIMGADYRLIKDERRPRFIIPEGVALPACLEDAYVRSRTSSASRLQEFKAVSPMHFSNAGGVYKATLPNDEVHVLREARSHTGLDARGRDAVARQRDEEATLKDLAGLAGVQQFIGSFWAWEHRYLELEYAPGRTLTSWVVQNSPFDSGQDGERRATYARRVVHIGQQVISILDSIHARGWAIGDLHPGNILIDDDDTVTIIDFEDATRVDEERAVGLRVFEFCGPEDLDAVESDWFAISRSLMLAYVPDWEIEAIAPSYWSEAERRVETSFGDEAIAQIRDVVGRFRPVAKHLLAPHMTMDTLSATPAADALVNALDEGIEWSRQFSPKGAFPGDPAQEGDVSESLGFGRAGIVWARERIGRPNAAQDLDALEEACKGSASDPGLYTGSAGIALALVDAGRGDAARSAASLALTEAIARKRLDLFGGRAGAVLAALEVARALDDGDLMREALATNDRLQRSVVPGTSSWTDLTHRRGYYHGLTGLALTDIVAHLATGDLHPLHRAIDRLHADIESCITIHTGELMVRDADNNRALPYIEWGSAGVWAVTMLAERLTQQRLLTRAQYDGLVRACSSDIYIYGTLLHGRAGIMTVLAAAGADLSHEVDRQRDLLTRALLERDGMVFTAGDGMIRLSSDVATGAAGLAVALNGVATGRPFSWLPLRRVTTDHLSSLPVPSGAFAPDAVTVPDAPPATVPA